MPKDNSGSWKIGLRDVLYIAAMIVAALVFYFTAYSSHETRLAIIESDTKKIASFDDWLRVIDKKLDSVIIVLNVKDQHRLSP